jgi:magnesium chelatase family protein
MLVKTFASAVTGIDAVTVTIEVNVSQGIRFFLVGLPDVAVKESQQRIESALRTLGHKWPGKQVVINMAPADIRKEGSSYDLPLAVGILAANEKIAKDTIESFIIMGELIEFFNGTKKFEPVVVDPGEIFRTEANRYDVDFSDVRGQESVKRALEVAAAGNHNVIMIGPPGSGKTMLAKRLPTIIPPLILEEALETTKIHSVAGKIDDNTSLMTKRPFRSPHHTISDELVFSG